MTQDHAPVMSACAVDLTMQSGSIDILVQRQLDTITSGNGAYLETFLRVARRAGLRTRVVFAPRHSFGNRPWAGIHPRLASLIDDVAWPGAIKIASRYWSTSPTVWGRFFVRGGREVLKRLGMGVVIRSYLGRPVESDEAAAIAAVCNADPSDITIAEYSSMGPVLMRLEKTTGRGVLMHDLLSDRGPRFRVNGLVPDFHEVTREEEAFWCAAADMLIYASANEMKVFDPHVPGAASVWLRPEPPEYGATATADAPRIVFIGTTHAGNADALHHFLDAIWPRVRSRLPDIQLWIVGSVGATLIDSQVRGPGVEVLGRVEKLEDIGGPSSIGVAPTRLATGVSIKVVEYLMLEMCCVAYPLALEGFGGELTDVVDVEDTPERFADRLVALARDEGRASRARAGRIRARSVLSNRQVEEFLAAVVDQTPVPSTVAARRQRIG